MSYPSIDFGSLYLEKSRNGIYKGKEFLGAGVKLIKMSQQFGYRFINCEIEGYELIELTDDELSRFHVRKNDLLFSRTSVVPEGVGMCSIVTDLEEEVAFESNILRVRLDKNKINPEYVFRYFQSPRGRGSVLSIAGGVNIKTIKGTTLKNLKIPNPDRMIQDKVVDVLRKYDDLIENNRRRIQLLEESARLLYKEWFVQLRFPGHEHVKVTNGVPNGWELKTAFDVMDVLSGGTPKTKVAEYWDGEIPFFTPKDTTDCAFTYNTEKMITESGLAKCNSHLYQKYTLFITARGTVGKLSFAQRPMAMNQSCYALVGKEGIDQQFLYCSLLASIEQFKARASGAVFDAIIVDTFKMIPFLKPSSMLIEQFNDNVKEIFEQVDQLSSMNRKLAEARDILLPRLMNGDLAL